MNTEKRIEVQELAKLLLDAIDNLATLSVENDDILNEEVSRLRDIADEIVNKNYEINE